ncbi:MAG: VOC family protein [Gemmatimonadetes bacterium]|nr:VOC family protein [Gemmatimonadota bacterium]
MQHTPDAAPATVTPRLTRLTPILIVDAVEPCLRFWVDRFGFATANKVPGEDGKLVFASVERDGIEIMYQTRASVAEARPADAGELNGHSVALFLEVDDFDAVERAVQGAPVVKPRHETFYGSTELYVREPGGNVVGFAWMAPTNG